jgi:hypothetical protein
MAKDSENSQGASEDDGAFEGSQAFEEDPQPIALRPQEIPRAEGKPLPPRPREQALPEKDDDRFFDRWVVDKARALGGRAVRQPALERLMRTVRTFAEWRSLRHAPTAEQESLSDRALVASTSERIKSLEAEATQLELKADETAQEAAGHDRDANEAAEKIADLRPALRGSRFDFRLLLLSNLVVFGVDFYIIQVALETIPGTPEQHRLTAAMLGGGAVVVGDVIGWMAAAGSFRRDGALQRPRPVAIAAVSSLLILAVLFFGELGDFREVGLEAAKDRGPDFGDPTFFTIAQILFLIASAVVSFAYVGRRTGRELRSSHEAEVAKHAELKSEVKLLRTQAAEARKTAAEAPARRLEAEERIRSRERIAADKAKHDLKQGEYLESLVVPEYMRERAAVESGIYRWQFDEEEARRNPTLLGPIPAVVATLAAGGLVYWVMENALVSIFVGLIVGASFALALAWRNAEGVERGRSWRYVAQLTPSARKNGERATDIEHLVPVEDAEPVQNGDRNGNGRKYQTRAELQAQIKKVKEILGDEIE